MNASEYTSIGRASADLGIRVVNFRHLARELAVEPALVLNGVPHFTNAQIDRIAAQLDHLHPIASRVAGLR